MSNKNNDNFMLCAWRTDLSPLPVNPELNASMSLHYNSVKEHFAQLEEIAFIGQCQYVKMTYVETKMRSLKEQQDFEMEMDDQLSSSRRGGEIFQDRMEPRRGRKHVFFNAETGEKVFEYGGIQEPLEVVNCNGATVKAYEIGMLFKEIKEEKFRPQLLLLVAGDFLDEQMKQSQIIMDWGMVAILIDMQELFQVEGQEAKMERLRQIIKDSIPSKENGMNKSNFYVFDSKWIEKNYYNWENDIKIQATRKFDTYALINAPEAYGIVQSPMIYVTGPKFMPNESMAAPYFVKLPSDAKVCFSKNQLIKDQIFYDLIQNHEVRSYCLRADMMDPHSRLKCTNMVFTKLVGRHDNFLQIKKN